MVLASARAGMKWKVGQMRQRLSAGVIVEHNDRLLLVRHVRPGRYDFWVAPGGGVQGGETLSAAAEREVREESGLNVAVGKLVYIEELVNPELRVCKFWYRASLLGGILSATAPEAQAEHIAEAAWLTRAELEGRIVYPAVLTGRYWDDKKDGFPSVVQLDLRPMEVW
jgi:8-oxo-dGTP diphosphatase